MGLAGGVDVAGVLWITVGRLAAVAAELCSQVATPAKAPLVVLPETTERHIFSTKIISAEEQKPLAIPSYSTSYKKVLCIPIFVNASTMIFFTLSYPRYVCVVL